MIECMTTLEPHRLTQLPAGWDAGYAPPAPLVRPAPTPPEPVWLPNPEDRGQKHHLEELYVIKRIEAAAVHLNAHGFHRSKELWPPYAARKPGPGLPVKPLPQHLDRADPSDVVILLQDPGGWLGGLSADVKCSRYPGTWSIKESARQEMAHYKLQAPWDVGFCLLSTDWTTVFWCWTELVVEAKAMQNPDGEEWWLVDPVALGLPTIEEFFAA
jgi:hypothetical protein